MKVIIPVAGVGSRLRPHTYTTPKALLTVAGAPMIDYILLEIEQLNPEKVIFIIGHLGEQICEYVPQRFPNLPVEFREQENAEGLGHAVSLGLDEGEREVLIILGDTLFESDLEPVVNGAHSSLGSHRVDDARRFGVILQSDGFVKQLIEKPDKPPSNEVIVGIYWLKEGKTLRNVLTEMIHKNERVRGEFQLTTALQKMIERGSKMTTFDVPGWFDCGKVETLLETNRYYLTKKLKAGETLSAHYDDTILIPPVSIAPSATVSDSVIGPYVTIGAGASVCNSVVKNSIVERDAKVYEMLLSNSLIGPSAIVSGSFQQMNVSESSEVTTVKQGLGK